MPLLSVVIPVYKAQDCIEELYQRLSSSLQEVTSDYEILLVEDCGGDLSWKRIGLLCQSDSRVKGIQLSRNFGQHYALTAGLDRAQGEWVVVMDCDLQDRPEEIPRLYAKAQEGYDIVVASRQMRQDGFFKRLSSKMYYGVFSYLSGMKYDGTVGNFRIMSQSVVQSFRQFRERLRFFGALINWMGFSVARVEVSHAKRFSGKSSYTFRKLLSLGIDTIIAYSDKPLRLAVGLGAFMSLGALTCGGYIFYQAITHQMLVVGWASLFVSLYFLGGIIIGILGILGIYLGKTFDETKKRPLYLIRESLNG